MRITREKIFGPVLSVLKWEDGSIEAAHDVGYGLTAAIYTTDRETAHRAAEKVETGYVWLSYVNGHYWTHRLAGRRNPVSGERRY